MKNTQDWVIVRTKTGEVQGKLSSDTKPVIQMELMNSGYETYPEDEFNKFGLEKCRDMYDIEISDWQ